MARVPRELVLERERVAWELRQARRTHAEIAAALGLERSAVTKILGRLHARYAQSLLADIAQVQGEQLVDLAWIRDEALAAWERSKAPAETVTTKHTTVDLQGLGGEALGALPTTETTRKLAYQVGGPEYLGKALEALAAMRKITGAEARDISDDALNDAIERELARLAGQGPPAAAAPLARPHDRP